MGRREEEEGSVSREEDGLDGGDVAYARAGDFSGAPATDSDGERMLNKGQGREENGQGRL